MRRLMRRSGLDEGEARKRIDAQMPQEGKKALADHLIDTSGSYEETERQVVELLKEIRSQETE